MGATASASPAGMSSSLLSGSTIPSARPGPSLAPRESGWVSHVPLAPHVLQPLAHPAPLCLKRPWASEQEPWTSPPGSCWGSATRNTISPAAWRNLGGEEPPFWVHGLPKVPPVMLVRPGLLPFFPPWCVLLPLPVNAGTSRRARGGWWLSHPSLSLCTKSLVQIIVPQMLTYHVNCGFQWSGYPRLTNVECFKNCCGTLCDTVRATWWRQSFRTVSFPLAKTQS